MIAPTIKQRWQLFTPPRMLAFSGNSRKKRKNYHFNHEEKSSKFGPFSDRTGISVLSKGAKLPG